MSLTPSNMLALGTIAPDFTLPDTVSQKNISLTDIASKQGTVVMFICNHCPFVTHIKDGLAKIAVDYQQRGVSFVAICSNDITNYPEDSPEKMRDFAINNAFNFPYLFDESQQTAMEYQAACTPDFFLFDENLKCVYRGRFDDSTPGKDIPITGKDLRAAIDNLINKKAIDYQQIPSIGCNIKWKEVEV